MSQPLPERPAYFYSENDWIQLRAHFMGSILADIHLHKLAQNIGSSWPMKGADETPAKYLEYSYDELADAPGLKGQPARLQLLLEILKETASFDEPFQEMVDTAAPAEKSTTNTTEILRKLSIPPEYPLEYTALSPETRNLCAAEGAKTVGECVALFQSMAHTIILGGEVRQLLNGLVHLDSRALSGILPLRPGTRGFQLPEAIGILVRSLPAPEREACIDAAEQSNPTRPLADPAAEAAYAGLEKTLAGLLNWFPEDTPQLRELAKNENALNRYFVPLGDAAVESAAALLCRRFFSPAPATVEPAPPTGLVSRLTSFFRRQG